MGIVLGLDIGIASVGYCLIDTEAKKIVNMGVRLFESADANNNKERREARGARRNLRRKNYRLASIDELLIENKFFLSEDIGLNPYELRVKGLTKKLDENEIYPALYHLSKRRGISYLDEVEDEGKITNDSLKINKELLKDKYPCEIQLERLNKYKQARATIEIEKEDGSTEILMNIFTTNSYKKEAEQILKEQSKYYKQINAEFIRKYIDILTRKREFYIGPGDENNRTNYGIYKTDGRTIDSIFEELIGKCSIYKGEQRAPRSSFTAQEFNLLNDLNNLTINGEKLNGKEKSKIVDGILKSARMGTASMLKIIKEITKVENKNEIKGVGIDKEGKMSFENTFESERKITNYLKNSSINYESFSIDDKDKMAIVLSKSMDYKSLVKNCNKSFPELGKGEIDLLYEFLQKNKPLYSGWHSFSIKLMKEMREVLYEKPVNQMNIQIERGIKKSVKESFGKYKYIPLGFLDEEIYNPVVRRSINQTIKIINAIIKKYGDLEAIVIEMPRDSNQEDEKKKLEMIQAKNEKEKNEAIERARNEYGFTEEQLYRQRGLLTKMRLWYQQDGRCIYTGKVISIQDLVNGPDKFEIDHIIPKSVSLDDSLNNKVLCYYNANQIKGQKTPFRAFSINTNNISYVEIKARAISLLELKKISRIKHDLLTFEEDINKYEVRHKFISRNLNDTRYASKAILNGLQEYMNEKDKFTKIHVIRGKFTYQIRRRWGIEKDREESFDHHGVDATIVAASYMLGQSEDTVRNPFLQSIGKYNKSFWKIVSNKEYDKGVYNLPWKSFIKDLNIARDQIKYSHKIDSKVNRAISDATLYSTRNVDGNDYIVEKYKNIYDNVVSKKLIKKIKDDLEKYENPDDSMILMRKHDIKTFQKLVKIIEEYEDETVNPFEAYRKEHGYITKYSKKGNGSDIKDIKYLSKKLGQGIEIEKTENISKNKKVVLLSLNPFRTDVYYNRETGKYKNLGIKYNDLKYFGGEYIIELETYNEMKNRFKIDSAYKFLFSLHKNDIVEIITKDESHIENRFRFLSSRADNPNKIKLKPINRSLFDKNSLLILGTKTYKSDEVTINRNVLKFKKYHTDILGNVFEVKDEKRKFKFTVDNINNM